MHELDCREMFGAPNDGLRQPWKVAFAVPLVILQSIRVQQQDVTASHQGPFVELVSVLVEHDRLSPTCTPFLGFHVARIAPLHNH